MGGTNLYYLFSTVHLVYFISIKNTLIKNITSVCLVCIVIIVGAIIFFKKINNTSFGSLEEAAIVKNQYVYKSLDQRMSPMASTAKVVTALCILHKFPLAPYQMGPRITFQAGDVSLYQRYVRLGGSVVSIKEHRTLSEREALEVLLIPSADNMAISLANWAFGSIHNFNDYANNYLQRNGLRGTRMTDPSGYNDSTMSTANDLARIGVLAMQNPVISAIVATKTINISGVGLINNTNTLLGNNGNIGIKTGHTNSQHGSYLFASNINSSKGTTRFVGAVMNAQSLTDAMSKSQQLIWLYQHGNN